MSLASANPEEVYDAIIDVGKRREPEMVDRVVPYLTSPIGFLREAALRTLVVHLRLPEYKADAIRMLDGDPDWGVRQAAAVGLNAFAANDPDLVERLVIVALSTAEDEVVRNAAFLSALVAAGIERTELSMARWLPGFDANADWALLARALGRAGMAIPPGLAERAAASAAAIDVDRLHAWCERICALSTDDVAEVAAALGIAGAVVNEPNEKDASSDVAVIRPPPPGATQVELARFNGGFTHVGVMLAGRTLTRGDFDRRFGPGNRLPRVGRGRSYVVTYHVAVAGAPFTCAAFATISDFDALPREASAVTQVQLRRGRARR